MQCPQCGFENLPKNTSCTRCRAQLVVDGPVVKTDFVPPRARDWKFVRPLRYRMIALCDLLPTGMPARIRRMFVGDAILPRESLAALLFSVIPGLGHLLSGQRRVAGAIFCGWLLLLALNVLLFGSTIGYICLGLLMSGHAIAAAHAGQVHTHIGSLRGRLSLVLLLLIFTALVYGGLYARVLRMYDLVPTALDFADLGAVAGDQILVRRGPHTWARGDIAVASEENRLIAVGPDGGRTGEAAAFRVYGEVLLRVIALPGERVQIGPQGVTIAGVDAASLQLWTRGTPLPQKPMEIVVPPGQMVAVVPATVPEGVNLARSIWFNYYLRPMGAVSGRGVAVYFPLLRRHWFEANRSTALPAR